MTIHPFDPKESGECTACGERKYHPSHHDFTTHVTYTGEGCAHCGRPDSEHPAKRKQ